MSVIPFNPGGSCSGGDTARSRKRQGKADTRARAAQERQATPEDSPGPSPAARLERALLAALRENARNWARAELAERMLDDRQHAQAIPSRSPSD